MKIIDVSVIVLTHNHEKYLKKALESILMQETTYKYEIVVLNNGSDDGTGEIIDEFSGKYPGVFNVITQMKKKSPTECSLEAMVQCKGRYLASCEGDDFWVDKNKLQKQIDFLEKHKEYVGCTHPIFLVGEGNDIISRKRLSWVSGRKVFRINNYDGLHLPGHISSFVRRNLFLNKGFDGTLIPKANEFIGDRTSFLLWLEKGDIYQLRTKMSAYRVRKLDGSLTKVLYKANLKHSRMEFNMLNQINDYTKRKGLKVKLKRRFLSIYADSVYDCIKYRDKADKCLPRDVRCQIGSGLCNISLPFFLLRKVFRKIVYFT
jgi:glycosyltransferase involved in cell wall biosynthesis